MRFKAKCLVIPSNHEIGRGLEDSRKSLGGLGEKQKELKHVAALVKLERKQKDVPHLQLQQIAAQTGHAGPVNTRAQGRMPLADPTHNPYDI